MKRREIFKNPLIGRIQQGCIFNNAYSTEYENCKVYGLIITPRCDIENEKVNTYHYLPLINFEDWKKKGFWHLLKGQITIQLILQLKLLFTQYTISHEILHDFKYEKIQKSFEHKITKQKDKDKFDQILNELIKLSNIGSVCDMESLKYFSEKNSKTVLSILKEVIDHKHKEYYLIENWITSEPYYYVIFLREIKKISSQIGEKIGNGLFISELISEDLLKNDIVKSDSDDMIYVETEIVSPYIEHIIQLFFQNFGKIGVSNYIADIHNSLYNQIIK